MTESYSHLDPAEFALRCLDTQVDASQFPVPCVPARPGSARAKPAEPMPRQEPDAQGDRFGDLLGRAHYRMFPPHLYPPVLAEPLVLRHTFIGAVPIAGIRSTMPRWVCPQGRAFTIQEAHLRGATGFVAAEIGFMVRRQQRLLFDGTQHTVLNPDKSQVVQPLLLPIAASEPVAFISLPWATTILAGERVELDLVISASAALNATVEAQLRGYTFPMELLPAMR